MATVLEARASDNSVQERTPANFIVDSAETKASKWLASLVKEAREKGKPVSRIVDLTPALATVLLNHNDGNRKVSRATVDTYAHDINIGAWEMNGEPIIVSDGGELNDGQHRCVAVLESGKTIPVVLVAGVDRTTRLTLNRGKTRSVGDYLSMEGHVNAIVLGAVAGHLWSFRSRGTLATGSNHRATKSEILDTVSQNPGLDRSVAFVQVKGVHAAGGPTILAFCHFVFSAAATRAAADNFIFSLMDGAGLQAGDPRLYVRNRLINERGRFKAHEKAELIFRAWNAWRRSERVTFFRITGDVLPVLED